MLGLRPYPLKQCFCAKTLPQNVTFDYDGCTATCKGNSGETCGGSKRSIGVGLRKAVPHDMVGSASVIRAQFSTCSDRRALLDTADVRRSGIGRPFTEHSVNGALR